MDLDARESLTCRIVSIVETWMSLEQSHIDKLRCIVQCSLEKRETDTLPVQRTVKFIVQSITFTY